MKRSIYARTIALISVLCLFTGCGSDKAPVNSEVACKVNSSINTEGEGQVFNIYCWHEEFREYFEMYYSGIRPIEDPDGSVLTTGKNTGDEVYYEYAKGLPEGITINWIVNPNDDGIYQDKLDQALLNQADAAADDRVDMFLAEADFITKYANSEYTADITTMGVTDFDNTYEYTMKACTSADGIVKGISFQCCPSAIIYRRSIAIDVLGTDDPDKVQEALSTWDKFDEVAAIAKEKGYYMVPSYTTTYKAFANNVSTPWVDENNNLNIDPNIQEWIDRTDNYVKNGYCLTSGIWDSETTAQMFASGKSMCFFGPAWYFRFSMGNAQDPELGCYGDWAVCRGPMPHFWGGTWLLAAEGTDNPSLIADIMNTFINDPEVCRHLISDQGQFSNNKVINAEFANDPNFGDDFLSGQNSMAVYYELADEITFNNATIYDQLCGDGLQSRLQEYWKGQVSKEDAMYNFYIYINEKYPGINTPE